MTRTLLLSILALALCASVQAQRTIRIKIDRADVLRHDDKIGKNTQSLNGNVKLSHLNTILHCDSAYMYNDSNVVVCYGSVHVIQNDSVHLYGDRLTYLGDQNLARVRQNVRANKGDTWLYTEHLDYDRRLDIAYFYNGGKVVNNDNTLTSERGIYHPMTNDVFFKDNVVGTSPKYHLVSDTAAFNTRTEVVSILGPTTITTSDSTIINSHNGWYDTHSETAKLLKNNLLHSVKNKSTLIGKTILYQRRTGLGTAWDDMILTDSTNNIAILGDYGFYNEITQEALATRRPILKHAYNADTLFLHADTFRIVPLADTSRLIKAFHNVKAFRTDLQARCDSLVFDFRDSIATLYTLPVVWSQGSQMTANTIKLFTRNQAIYKAELIEAAFIISQEPDSVGFDQVKGKLITGHIRNNDLYLIDVDGNGQTIYYPKDGPNLIGVNRAESSNMSIHLKERKIDTIIMRVSPTGNMNPPLLFGEKDNKLAGFRWLEDYRPKNKEQIFLKLQIPPDMQTQEDVYVGYNFDDIGQ
ncbi:MAG: hypothetical protein II375_02875 [Bacteroidales bacterium]|nr:hypothetical protein [Bacteroidales bacterium]